MDFIKAINEAIGKGYNAFVEFIQGKKIANPSYLEQLNGVYREEQHTVLNYLITIFGEDPAIDLSEHLRYVLANTTDVNMGEPLHRALSTNKMGVFTLLMDADKDKKVFQVNQRDVQGSSLLALVLESKSLELLQLLLTREVNVNATTNVGEKRTALQPLYHAIVLDFAAAVKPLVEKGAQLTNRMGLSLDTPILLAARLGKVNALKALLDCPYDAELLAAENNNIHPESNKGHTAIEELCNNLAKNQHTEESIEAVAMLLCCGAEPPRYEDMRCLLSNNRLALLKAVKKYLEQKPDLVDAFVERCHLKESQLHLIVYADHSWGSSLRHLFGVPSESAILVEDLVTTKYRNPANAIVGVPSLSSSSDNLAVVKNPLQLYAEFVRRYQQAYECQVFPNPWSTMRWMITGGLCDWETVVRYANNNKGSRTQIIYEDMMSPVPVKDPALTS